MSQVTQQLIDDHAHMQRVLVCIDHCAQRYFSQDREEQDLEIIQLALEYMDTYADRFHHPLEEAVMDTFAGWAEEMPEQGEATLRQQHVEITGMTDELRKLFDVIANDHVVPYDKVSNPLDDYIKLQFEHLKFENENFLPLIDNVLNQTQLEQLEIFVKAMDDPMFSNDRQHFEELYRYLLHCEKAGI